MTEDFRPASNRPNDKITDKLIMGDDLAQEEGLLCHIRKTPLVLYGMFVNITQQLYGSDINLPIDVCAKWDKDPTKTKIWIDTEYKWEDESPAFRPAIYIKLGQITYKSVTGRHDALYSVDLVQGEQLFSRSGAGTATWVHIGSSKGESVALAGATLDFLDGFATVIRDDLNFQTFQPASLNATVVDKEAKERYRSEVVMEFMFEDNWAIKLESPKLKRIVFMAGQQILDAL